MILRIMSSLSIISQISSFVWHTCSKVFVSGGLFISLEIAILLCLYLLICLLVFESAVCIWQFKFISLEAAVYIYRFFYKFGGRYF